MDYDTYYRQYLLDRSDAFFLTDKASIDSDIRVDCLWFQQREKSGEFRLKAIQNPVRLTKSYVEEILSSSRLLSLPSSDSKIF